MKILIVCTGNSCRSPMAEAFLKKYLNPHQDFEIVSAGISGIKGLAPTREAIEVMKEEAIDISPYRSKPFSEELAKDADIILVMSDIHKDFILDKVPQAKSKMHLFKDFAGIKNGDKQVYDPIGQSLTTYKVIKEEIKEASIKIARKIIADKSSL